MRRWYRPILLMLVLALLLPGAAARGASDGPDAPEAAYDGYLVKVRPDAEPRISPYSAGAAPVADTLYVADSLEEIRSTWSDDTILYIEPNYIITPDAAPPNDPLYGQQWNLPFMGAPSLWDSAITCDGVRIAVIDSGVSFGHEDLDYSRIAAGYNYPENNRDVTDVSGHGTAAIGLIAATRNNGRGMAGLLDRCIIVPLKVFHQEEGTVADGIRAIYDAVDTYQCDVINISWGTLGHLQSLEDAVTYAASKNVLLVASAGNDGPGSALRYPAAYDAVVGVGSVDNDGTVSSFSQRNGSVFVTAPGGGVISTTHNTRDGYARYNGTSFSAPQVTAMAAAAKATVHDMGVFQFMHLLQTSAVDRGPAGYDTAYGHGTVDFGAFLAALPPSNWVAGFRDIPTGHWARGNVVFVTDTGLFYGTTSYTFSPEEPMTRAMLVTVLGRLHESLGGVVPARSDTFTDTAKTAYYSRYVAWAAEAGIAFGTGGGRFEPEVPVTRQETAAFLRRFAAYTGIDVSATGSLSQFLDAASVAGWARDAMSWAVDREILFGIDTSAGLTAAPEAPATRAQVAAFMERFIKNLSLEPAAAAA